MSEKPIRDPKQPFTSPTESRIPTPVISPRSEHRNVRPVVALAAAAGLLVAGVAGGQAVKHGLPEVPKPSDFPVRIGSPFHKSKKAIEAEQAAAKKRGDETSSRLGQVSQAICTSLIKEYENQGGFGSDTVTLRFMDNEADDYGWYKTARLIKRTGDTGVTMADVYYDGDDKAHDLRGGSAELDATYCDGDVTVIRFPDNNARGDYIRQPYDTTNLDEASFATLTAQTEYYPSKHATIKFGNALERDDLAESPNGMIAELPIPDSNDMNQGVAYPLTKQQERIAASALDFAADNQ